MLNTLWQKVGQLRVEGYDIRIETPIGEYTKGAHLCPKVCGQNVKRWEDWIFVFAQKGQIDVSICTLRVRMLC